MQAQHDNRTGAQGHCQLENSELAKLVIRNKILRKRCKHAARQLDKLVQEAEHHAVRDEIVIAQNKKDAKFYGDDFDEVEGKNTLRKLEAQEASLFKLVSAEQRGHHLLLSRSEQLAESQVQKDGERLYAQKIDLELRIKFLQQENQSIRIVVEQQKQALQIEVQQNEPIRKKEESIRQEILETKKKMKEAALQLPKYSSTKTAIRKHENMMVVHCENDSLVKSIKFHQARAAELIPSKSRPSPRHCIQEKMASRICAQLHQRCDQLQKDHAYRMQKIYQRYIHMKELEENLRVLRSGLSAPPGASELVETV